MEAPVALWCRVGFDVPAARKEIKKINPPRWFFYDCSAKSPLGVDYGPIAEALSSGEMLCLLTGVVLLYYPGEKQQGAG